jgi:predicted Zn-dependent protease
MRDALAVYGHLLLSCRQFAKAHAVFKGMAVLFPDDALVVRSLGMTSLALGQPEAALTYATRAKSGSAEEEAVAVELVRARALAALGRESEARAAMGEVLVARSNSRPIKGRSS